MLLLFVTPILSILFQYKLQPYKFFCVNQVVDAYMPFLFSVIKQYPPGEIFQSNIYSNAEFQMNVFGSDQTLVFQHTTTSYEKFSKYTDMEQDLRFCVNNPNSITLILFIEISGGIKLNDLQALPKKEDQMLIDDQIEQISRTAANFGKNAQRRRHMNEFAVQTIELISLKIFGFSFLAIFTIIGLNYCQFLQVRKVLRLRKYI